MGGPDGRVPVPEFNRARAIGGLALLAVAATLFVFDVLSASFAVDSVQLGLLLGAALLLLGVEGGRKFLG